MSLLNRLFAREPDPRERLRPLWNAVVATAREPHWYAECGVADSVAGRFDMISAVLALVTLRMERDGDLASQTALLTELFVADMDAQVRELGVGDIVVGKHMGKLVGALGGRIEVYRKDVPKAVENNVTLGETGSAACVADKLAALAARLERTGSTALLVGEIAE
jgi:cytochrome b pre-mRNA-processing protein 3